MRTSMIKQNRAVQELWWLMKKLGPDRWHKDALTPAEVEDEAAYYAWLESKMAAAVVVVDPVNFCDNDDHGECGPTCGKYGNW